MKNLVKCLLTLLGTVAAGQGDVSVSSQALEASVCSGSFVKHTLEHRTRSRGAEVTYYDSNGGGVALGDLNRDGLIDIVLAGLKGENTVLWNEGALTFRPEALGNGDSRAVSIVDVEGDGWPDIVFSQSLGVPSYWQNIEGTLERAYLSGVNQEAYTFIWGDLDADGDLDLVTASYDSLLEKDLRDSFLFSDGAGVMVYMQENSIFEGQRLAETSQALALTLFDANGDGAPDIIVGNDFGTPDYQFLNLPNGWTKAEIFAETTRNTMSFASADVDNSGAKELLATDMKPDFGDPAAIAAWTPLLQKSYERTTQARGQLEENVLYAATRNGYQNRAYDLGLDATGWSWSGKFGDLDNDGLLDLYVVNGMIAKEAFPHLPNFELIEENRAFRQTAQGFDPADDWRLNATESGRGMSLADLDNDGDLDIVVNNLNAAATLFENQVCGGAALEVDLYDPKSANSRAVGAVVQLETSTGTLQREVTSSSGYLSGDPARLHFGFPADAELTGLSIRWPNGTLSRVSGVSAGSHLSVTRELP